MNLTVVILDVGTAELIVICDDRVEQIGDRYRAQMDSLPNGSPEHAEAFRRHVEPLRDHRNRDGGFWVASADPLAAEHALTDHVPTEIVRAAALLSDGASRLVDRFALSTWRQLLDVLASNGPAELIRRVRTAEHSDPHGSRRPRAKTHDDATAVHCTLPSCP